MSKLLTQDIERRLIETIISLGAPADAVQREARLDALDIDSLDLAEFAQIVEDEYGVAMQASDMAELATVGDAIDFVTARA
jgi:acyl carrier protein